ncbi:hypothetical protein l11_06170 [Neisseria weaveri LMG 5135]|nr:hypothetical protein l11_06170 [Neisseria weaveri LMG 5135]
MPKTNKLNICNIRFLRQSWHLFLAYGFMCHVFYTPYRIGLIFQTA